ncbi:hypothetical protein Fmac_026041 [Flemingia macrophylla]|uniref:Uncharacterized protein n=1 Tax=Flemingia macrophylla TaxID=520843 RepID=A0ABD1LDS9_9FABA
MVHFSSFHGFSCNYKYKQVWEVIWVTVAYSIWKHRNVCIFNSTKFENEKIP